MNVVQMYLYLCYDCLFLVHWLMKIICILGPQSIEGSEKHMRVCIRVIDYMIHDELKGYKIKILKLVTKNNPKLLYDWKSIFFLVVLLKKDNFLPHKLDVMHIEKNVLESVFGTLLNDGRRKKHNMNTVSSNAKMLSLTLRGLLYN